MYGLIYCATNMINGKKYVGQTKQSLKRRIKGHKDKIINKNDNTHFHNALKKYGLNNFMWTILCYAENKEALDKAEIYWIEYYHTIEIGYNHQDGGYNGKPSLITRKKMSDSQLGKEPWNKGKCHTEESKLKMSCSHLGNKSIKGKHHTKETKEKIGKARLGKPAWNKGLKGAQKAWNKGKKMGPLSEEHRKKISEVQKNKILTEETKLKMSLAAKKAWANPEIRARKIAAQHNRGPISEETRNRMSEAKKGKKLSEEHKNKIGIASKGRVSWITGKHHTEDTKRKISIATREQLTDPEIRKKISIAAKKQWANPKFKEKMIKTHKKRWEIYRGRDDFAHAKCG